MFTREKLQEIFNDSGIADVITADNWNENYTHPLSFTVKEMRELYKSFPVERVVKPTLAEKIEIMREAERLMIEQTLLTQVKTWQSFTNEDLDYIEQKIKWIFDSL